MQNLLHQINQLKLENEELKNKLKNASLSPREHPDISKSQNTLSNEEYVRYGRQMIVPQFGSLPAQKKLKQAKVLCVGAGGLGCPALLYLVAAGVGEIGIVDNDTVDTSNLHRQVLHTTNNVGMLKCDSAKSFLSKLNPHVTINTHPVRLCNENAFDIINSYHLVVDCTDAPAIRYLINDVSVLCGKTIVSGSGVRSEGQISILNFNNSGPCYRCFYPQPPAPGSVSSCGDAGVLGPAIGLTGTALATETIKVITGFYQDNFKPFLAMYTAYPHQQIRHFKMRGRQGACKVCGESPVITREAIELGTIDYSAFCGSVHSNVLLDHERVTADEAQKRILLDPRSVLLDVRPEEQFNIVHIPGSLNLDWALKASRVTSLDDVLPGDFNKDNDNLYVVCRYGNDSQLATRRFKDELGLQNTVDVRGGLSAWRTKVDPSMPTY